MENSPTDIFFPTKFDIKFTTCKIYFTKTDEDWGSKLYEHDWLVFNANFSSISAISHNRGEKYEHEKKLHATLQ